MPEDLKKSDTKEESIKVEAHDQSVAVGKIEVGGNVEGGIHIGNTIIQKFFNIFKSDAETLEHRNRRILLNHVENAWIKGVLDASLYGAAMLDLGIKETPEAVTNKYPWTLKKESTDETLPAGTSMLEIFDSIGMGRSLLILGAPGSGKTTMLLELTRGLIARAREDVTYPIPMVFNLASWTEKLTLADWLAQELNNLYSVPRKTAPDWVKGNKLLLLLDGLDEVRQESRAKCVEVINEFRKQNGLTSLAVCSRSQDYADLNAKLSFEGAIEVQPLTQEQIAEFFNRFGDEMAGIKQALEKDSELREMTETPLFLSIMIMAYRGKRDVDILVSQSNKSDPNIHPFLLEIKYKQSTKGQRKHLFDTYVERMFERRINNGFFDKQDTSQWLSWLAHKMKLKNESIYFVESMQPYLLRLQERLIYISIILIFFSLLFGILFGLLPNLFIRWIPYIVLSANFVIVTDWKSEWTLGWYLGSFIGLIISFFSIRTIDELVWEWKSYVKGLFWGVLIGVPVASVMSGTLVSLVETSGIGIRFEIKPLFGLLFGLASGLALGVKVKTWNWASYAGQKLNRSASNFLLIFLVTGLAFGGTFGWMLEIGNKSLLGGFLGWTWGSIVGVVSGVMWGLLFGGITLIQHYTLRLILALNNLLPWRLIPFLDHCVDLIFLRRVGGGYIFIHRLLMEHFAEMYEGS